MKHIYKNIWTIPLLVVFQIFILNNINFLGYANPYLYLIPIITLPYDTPKWILMIVSIYTGILLDLDPINFRLGMHSSILIFIAFIKPTLQKLILNKKTIEERYPLNLKKIGYKNFSLLAISIILIHNSLIFMMEYFVFFNFYILFLKVIISSLITYIVILITQLITLKNK